MKRAIERKRVWPALITGLSPSAAKASRPTAAGPATSGRRRSETTLRLWPGFVDVERPAVHGVAIECIDRLVSFGFVGHFHKRETAGAAGLTIGHDTGAVHYPVPFK